MAEQKETAVQESKKCPFASAQGAIDWLNKVDDFSVKGHKNKFPRWSFLVAALAVLAI